MDSYRKVLLKRFIAQEKKARWAIDSFQVTTLEELLDRATANVANQFKNSISVLLLTEEDYLVIKSATGLDINKVEHKRIPIGKSLSGRLVKRGEPKLFSDVSRITDTLDDNLEPYYCGSMISTPLVFNKKVIGLLNVYLPVPSEPFSFDDFNIVITYGNQTAFAIESQRLVDKRTEELKEAQARLVKLNEQLQQDIEVRKKVEEQLRKAEEKYRMQFEGALDAIFVGDAETGIIVDCNPAATRLVGRGKSELIGKHQRILHPPEEIEGELSKTFRQHLKEKQGQTLETQVITKTGEIRDVAIRANLLEIGGKKVLQGIFRDVTENKKAEEEIRKSQKVLRDTIDAMPFGVMVVGRDKKIKQANATARQLTGYGEGELLGQLCHQTLCPAEENNCPILDQKQTVDHSERKLITKDKREIPIIKNVVNLKLGNEDVLLEAFIDITERKEAERKLKQLNKYLEDTIAKLDRANNELKDFVYIASHDLREPLRKISSFGELLSTSLKDKLNDDNKENLDFMIDGAKRMQQMIDALLTCSRVTTKGVDFETVDLNQVVEELCAIELAVKIEETGAKIVTPERLHNVNCDPAQIRQLIQNLIANALKYQKKGAVPEITIRSSVADNSMVRVEVADNGIGIEEQHFKNLFVMFRRLHSRREYEGTGIGLAVCKKIVERHGGNIGVSSTYGEGSTFWFTMPKQEMRVKNEELQASIVS